MKLTEKIKIEKAKRSSNYLSTKTRIETDIMWSILDSLEWF
ncbi:hypothetical protein GMMP15_1900020 [Candidatus Magnetomoraceae bacterium gMMP-15]